MLQSMGLQSIGHTLVTEQQQGIPPHSWGKLLGDLLLISNSSNPFSTIHNFAGFLALKYGDIKLSLVLLPKYTLAYSR